MSDPTRLADRLERLAPQVDADAGRDLFERHRSGGGVPRWLMPAAVVVLVIAGVVGLWAVNRSDDTAPLAAPGTSLVNGPLTEGDGYETVFVGEVARPFGESRLAVTDDEYAEAWGDLGTGDAAPAVDLDRNAVLVMTRPDNACADTIVRFDVDNSPAIPTWTPVFQDLSGGCNDPLLSWVYVVAVDRAVLGGERAIRVPAAPIYDVEEVVLVYRSTGPVPDDGPVPGVDQLTETGLRVPLPAVNSPSLALSSFGLLWVVAHDEGGVSVLPAVIDARSDEDTGVEGVAQLVRVADDGESFAAGGFTWDARGRAINGGRANDLVGFAGRVDSGEVEVFLSDATRVAGSPTSQLDPGARFATATDDALAALWDEPIDTMTFFTLSSTGPIWRYLDATLVVENGVGRICDVATDAPVPDLHTCADADVAIDTAITSTDPDVTTWFHSPIIAWQDPIEGFTRVVPLGGRSSRNDAALDDFVALTPLAVVAVDDEIAPEIAADVLNGAEAATHPALADIDLTTVDWNRELLMVWSIEGSGCPTAVVGLSPLGDGSWTIEVEVVTDAGECAESLVHWLNVVPVAADALPSGAGIRFEDLTINWP